MIDRAASGAPPIRILRIGIGLFLRGVLDGRVDVANGRGVRHGSVRLVLARIE